jgi:lipopolysaccharide cholinephosphotransferase
MSGYDEYLSVTYGDYMKLPPVEKRVRHNVIVYAR